MDVTHLNFWTAFDTVQHKRLMLQVKALSITDFVFNWMQDWLQERTE
jgi:hypothetical protein